MIRYQMTLDSLVKVLVPEKSRGLRLLLDLAT